MDKDLLTKEKTKAEKCTSDCGCLTGSGAPACKITTSVNNTYFFTESRQPNGCAYQHAFGSSFICTCPVRQEIYLKQKI